MKIRPAAASLSVKRLDQVRALAHPLRYRIFERLVVQPGCPKAVALDMGLKETRLYHHFRVLENAGLIKRTRSQRKRGAIERTFAATAERVVLDKARFAGEMQPGGSVAIQALHAAVHEVERCEAYAQAQNRQPDLNVTRLILRISPERAAELESRFADLIAEAQRDDSGESHAEYHITLAAYRAAPRPSMGDEHETE
jgi:DNA-binding transcriptional ArsR family regulator